MDLKQLQAKGAYVKSPPVATEVTWRHVDEETKEEMSDVFTVHVRRMSVGWMDRVLSPVGADRGRSRTAMLISEGILFGEDGSEQMSYEDAYRLNFGLADVLLDAFNRVNQKGDADAPKA
jgi:hypothetical protein